MNIILYSTSSPAIQVSKALTQRASITGEPHEIVSDKEMTLRLAIGNLANVKASNYCYIPETEKYYYINPDYKIENQSVIIALKEDVLMSFRSQLLTQTCTVSRNEQLSNAYLFDNGYQLLAYKNIVCKMFPVGIDTDTIILMTIG